MMIPHYITFLCVPFDSFLRHAWEWTGDYVVGVAVRWDGGFLCCDLSVTDCDWRRVGGAGKLLYFYFVVGVVDNL